MWKVLKRWWSNLFKSDDQIESDVVGERRSSNLEEKTSFEALVDLYKKTDIKYNNLKNITLAQWMLESARGNSPLAKDHLNFAGLKWRPEMSKYATSVSYPAHDGVNEYCKFKTLKDFILGYWHFINRDVYNGWETHADTPEWFIQFIVDAGYCPDNGYTGSVLKLLSEANEELNGVVITPAEPEDNGAKEGYITKYPKGAGLLYYPKAVRLEGVKLKTHGRYKDNYPMGSVQHFTAGRSRTKVFGGSRNTNTIRERGERGIRSAADRNAYCYFLIDRDGTVYQSFPLNRYGSHAGESNWEGIGSSVSKKLVGIEMQNAGRLEDYWTDGRGKKHACPSGKKAAWFTRPDLGDEYFNVETECRYSNNNENIQKGWYHSLSAAQEKSLFELNLWLKRNKPSVFNLNYCLAHDEVSGKKGIGYSRKNDTGASLSMTMTTFRNKLKAEYTQRYN